MFYFIHTCFLCVFLFKKSFIILVLVNDKGSNYGWPVFLANTLEPLFIFKNNNKRV